MLNKQPLQVKITNQRGVHYITSFSCKEKNMQKEIDILLLLFLRRAKRPKRDDYKQFFYQLPKWVVKVTLL